MPAGRERFALLFEDNVNSKFYVLNATDDGNSTVAAVSTYSNGNKYGVSNKY